MSEEEGFCVRYLAFFDEQAVP